MIGTKHLIQCHCVLPQFRKMDNPIFHKFVVYSRFSEESIVEERLVKCNNCDCKYVKNVVNGISQNSTETHVFESQRSKEMIIEQNKDFLVK